jgi:3',5'-cyclic AMP phosphodiesterase CpdA
MREETAIDNSRNIDRRTFLGQSGLTAAAVCLGWRSGRLRSAPLDAASTYGKIDPGQAGIEPTGEDFDFAIFADPQGGDPNDQTNDSPERVAIHNPFILKNIEAVNRLNPPPAFLLVVGDIVDSKGQRSNYDVMVDYLRRLKTPVLFELGNHETRYGARITPDDTSELENYLRAQEQINGLGKLLYSFDLGRWHFVVWPDPLRRGFWEAHPHYFEWLADDLRRHRDRPTMLFQHISLLPIGIDPMIVYAEKVPVKRRLLETITRFGNVKYVFSGHTHIPLKASVKIARTYNGTTFINLPAAGYRARSFGEPDFGDGPSQGFALIKVRGENATVQFHRVTGEQFTYPKKFPAFEPEAYPSWLAEKWQLPARPQFVNGSFEDGLEGWARRFVYAEDEDPSTICEATDRLARAGGKSLYLFCRPRGYEVRGQDRMPQSINRVCQAIALEPGRAPLLRLAYRLEGGHSSADDEAGAYVWLEGYAGAEKRLDIIYWVGKGFPNPEGLYAGRGGIRHWDMTAAPDQWHAAIINVAKDHDSGDAKTTFDQLGLDKLAVSLGVWTENVGIGNAIGIYLDDLSIDSAADATTTLSRIDGRRIVAKPKNEMWNKRIAHIDGEHIFVPRTPQ